MMRFLIGVAILLLLWIVLHAVNIFNLPEPVIYQYITLALIVLVQPIVIFTTIRKNYYSSNHLRENLDFELTENKVMIRGESFYMEILWSKIHKVVEMKKWFLIYQNNLSAIIIPKKQLKQSEEDEIRIILKGLKEVPQELHDS
ncbi:MAG TPA: YcxB family protein [Flavobacterium sp.]|jgi:hypothetical protein|nr:YcxB family protein [Flavobacterium sp.]